MRRWRRGLGRSVERSEEDTRDERAGDDGRGTALAHAEFYRASAGCAAGGAAATTEHRYFGQGVSVSVCSSTRPLRPRRCSVYFVPRGTRLKVPADSGTSAIGSTSRPSPPTT